MSQEDKSKATAERREPLIPTIRVTPEERNRLILVSVAGLVLFWILQQSIDALGPFLFALALAYLMSPLVDLLNRKMPRTLAILLVYAIFLGITVGFLWWIAPKIGGQIAQLVDSVPAYQKRVQEYIDSFNQWYQSLPLSADVRTSIENAIRNSSGTLLGAVQQAVVGILAYASRTTGFIVGLLVIPFWLFYVLKDSDRGMKAFNSMLPRSWRVDVWRLLSIINGILSSYIRGQLLLAIAVGLATTVGMLLVGAPYALLLGLFSGITEVIPVIGPILGAVPGVLIALVTGDWLLVLKVVLVYVVVQQLENNLLVPKIQGDSVKLHPAIIIVALVIGSQVAGLVGLILAVPAAAIMRDVYLYLYRRLTEDYTPAEAEASVPSKEDEQTPKGKMHREKELAAARQMPGINSQEEMIEQVDKESADAEAAGRK